MRGGHAPYLTDMPFGVSSGTPNVINHAKFHVDRLVLHYRADCDCWVGVLARAEA